MKVFWAFLRNYNRYFRLSLENGGNLGRYSSSWADAEGNVVVSSIFERRERRLPHFLAVGELRPVSQWRSGDVVFDAGLSQRHVG